MGEKGSFQGKLESSLLIFFKQGILCLLGKCSTIDLNPEPLNVFKLHRNEWKWKYNKINKESLKGRLQSPALVINMKK